MNSVELTDDELYAIMAALDLAAKANEIAKSKGMMLNHESKEALDTIIELKERLKEEYF